MTSGLSENLASLKQEFTTAPVEEVAEVEVELPPTAIEPTGPVDSVDTEASIVEFPAPVAPVVTPLHVPITEPLAAETLKGEMSLAGFSAPSTHDLTLAAAMWSKKNYRGQSAAETVNYLLKEATPVTLKAEIDTFTPFNAEQTFSLLSETESKSLTPYLTFGGLLTGTALLAYFVSKR